MTLIVDSGSTKTDWCFLSQGHQPRSAVAGRDKADH